MSEQNKNRNNDTGNQNNKNKHDKLGNDVEFSRENESEFLNLENKRNKRKRGNDDNK